jgi:hypothetical protein
MSRMLRPLIRRWGETGRVVHPAVVSRTAIGLLFFGILTPVALVFRILGRDALRLKRDPKARTYWIERDPSAHAPTGPDKSQF